MSFSWNIKLHYFEELEKWTMEVEKILELLVKESRGSGTPGQGGASK